LEHWFGGDGYLLKLKFSGGEMSAQGRFLNTPIHARRQLSFPDTKINPFSKIYNKFRVPNYSNPANTSVLFQEHTHSSFLAICEGGWPFLVNTEDLESKGFNNFGWIDSAFSAHPKIDPDDKTIYNIGNKFPSLRIMKTPNSLERPIAQTDLKLR
jgi:carotenoid cleavage dioxygenase-like enzyme